MGLAEYKRKRDFKQTAEPAGGKPLPKAVKGASRFVIQKHDASRLHYDFRLQMDDVLKSWAVPKGLPWGQGEKHLAVEVEDHPVEYATFEGVIPAGQYGGGTVMVWDRGKYYVYGEQPLEAWREGKMHLVLEGEKAQGEWTLIRLRGNEDKPQWLLLKTGGSLKEISKKRDDQSVKTGRTMAQIAGDRDAEWKSNRTDAQDSGSKATLKRRIQAALKKKDEDEIVSPEHRLPRSKKTNRARRVSASSAEPISSGDGSAGALPSDLPKAKPRFVEPMKARLVTDPPAAGDWSYELKFDGFRACAVKDAAKISLVSRNGNDLRKRFPEVVEALGQLPADDCVLDGEIVALDDAGRSSFQLLQGAEMEDQQAPICFYVFDLLQIAGKSLLQLPLTARKEVLQRLCQGLSDPIRYSGEVGRDPRPLLGEIKRRGLEGLIGKLRDSVYEPGRRSGTWIKLKCVNEQEFVIGGYTPPGGSRKHFGAILVGYYGRRNKEGDTALHFAGKVGTGFDSKSLAALHRKFHQHERRDCPFVDLPSKQGGKWVQGITPSMMRHMHWIDPVLVGQVKFAEWTRDRKLRHPVFLGLREDKPAREVTSEA
jgi:bifunctional non-homologous end joining protein LigD